MVVTNNRLFVLTVDAEHTEERNIAVIEKSSKETIHEISLGAAVGKMFVKPDGNIIISYPTQHTALNSIDLTFTNTQYTEGTEPMFFNTKAISFDASEKMYYTLETNNGSKIPAVYNFDTRTAILYYFENFLTEAQLNVEYNIELATTVAYDEKNNFIIVGYKKRNQQHKGGLLRLAPSPNFSIIDNYDLNGVPVAVFDL